jgi:N-acetylglucosaminyldiphosphoundecaprenol N-acetyl-beta-D-mannosaminyltransferase
VSHALDHTALSTTTAAVGPVWHNASPTATTRLIPSPRSTGVARVGRRFAAKPVHLAWPPQASQRVRIDVLGAEIDAINMGAAVRRIADWAGANLSRTVCACNVHVAVTARSDRRLSDALATADLVVADGAPIAWLMRHDGHTAQHRVAGPDLMWNYFIAAEERRQPIYLYGGSEQTLVALVARIARDLPGLEVAGTHSPPYRELTEEEDDAVVASINASGAKTVWVALGCPRQEAWLAAHRSRVDAVMIGVGAAFNFHAGSMARAPLWMQRHSLEWLHRLVCEPRRLARRYAVTNSKFVVLAALRLLRRELPGTVRRSGE